MLEQTKKIIALKKNISELKKFLEGKVYDPNNAQESFEIATARTLIQSAEKEIVRAENERVAHRRAYHRKWRESKRADKDYMEQKRERENQGRARKKYFVQVDGARKRKFINIDEMLTHYSAHQQEPNIKYIERTIYSGNKIVDGIKQTDKILTAEDMAIL